MVNHFFFVPFAAADGSYHSLQSRFGQSRHYSVSSDVEQSGVDTQRANYRFGISQGNSVRR
jgi:hypothetical protein